MPSPLDDFANSPRRFRNDDGSEVVSSSLVKLGPSLVASRSPGTSGEATFVTVDAPGIVSQAAQIAALTARVEALEAAVKWTVTAEKTADYTAAIGELVRVDMAGLAAPDEIVITLPLATPANTGRSVAIVTSNDGGAEDGAILRLNTGGGQTINDSVPPFGPNFGEVRVVVVSTGSNWTYLVAP